MPFIMSGSFLEQLNNLQKEYEKRTGVQLDTAQTSSSISRFFGATDTLTRKKQFDFLKTIFEDFKPYIHYEPNSENADQQWQACVISLRIMLIACLYIKSQVTSGYTLRNPKSVMIDVIDEALGISTKNPLDEVTKKLCLKSAQEWLKLTNPAKKDPLVSKISSHLKTKDLEEFDAFVTKEYKALESIELPINFPISKALQSVFGAPFQLIGTPVGYMIGGILAERNTYATSLIITTMATNTRLIATLPGASLGAILLLPPLTSRVLNTLYGVSLSWIIGGGLRLVGEGIGFSVGFSLDLSLYLIRGTCNNLQKLLSKPIEKDQLTGLQLTDGHRYVNGVDLHVLETIYFVNESIPIEPAPVQIKASPARIEVIEDEDEEEEGSYELVNMNCSPY